MKQLPLNLKTRGGKREGAGRPPNGDKAGVPHLRRERFPSRHPVHVTLRTRRDAGYLRGQRRMSAIKAALLRVRDLRVIHFSVQGNHLHLLVEAENARALARGIQSLAIRIARALNRVARRSGKVFADRYHSRSLKTRREVANAIRYILENFRHHLREDVAPAGDDPCSSAVLVELVVEPRTWLVRNAGPPAFWP